MSGYGRAAGVGGAIGGSGGLGIIAGAALGGLSVAAAPVAVIVGSGAAIGAGLGTLGRLIFS